MKKLLLFLLCAVFAGSVAARADERSDETAPACTSRGVNLLDALKKTDPAAWKALQAEADSIPNHSGIIWKVEKGGTHPSYLFGTIHLSDPRVLKLPQAAEAAYRSVDSIAIETTDVLDPSAFLRLKLERPELMLFTDGSTLKSHIPADRREEIEKKLAERGVVLDAVARMKPWILTTVLAMPRCEQVRKGDGDESLDVSLAKEAKAEGRPVEGLETAAEQLEAMNRMPLDFHIRNLIATVDYGDRIEDAMETTTALYLQGETGLMMPALRKLVPDDLSDADYALFQKVLIVDRNHTMAERALPLLEKGNVFIAVGALHLPGQEGLVALLRAKGYRVTPL